MLLILETPEPLSFSQDTAESREQNKVHREIRAIIIGFRGRVGRLFTTFRQRVDSINYGFHINGGLGGKGMFLA